MGTPSRNLQSTKGMPESSSKPTPIKRACDACHRRKVKCIDGSTKACKNCAAAGLTCTYNAIPQKKGPKGSRAKVISELRENQRQSSQRQHFDPDGAALSPAYLNRSGLLSTEVITSAVDYFFVHLYPTQPILHRSRVGETIAMMDTNVEAYCLVVSLCAYMMIQPNMVLPPDALEGLETQPQSSLQLGQMLLQEALRVRKGYNYVETPTVWTIITSFFFFGSYFCLDKQNTAWFHLREATTLALIMGMHDEAHYQITDLIESQRRRRLYWLLFVTERAYALQQHRPLTLHPTINLPSLDDDPTETAELNGFLHLVKLFKPFDDTFVGLWNKSKTGCTTQYVTQLQQQLSDALPAYLQTTEPQAVDLRCSQQWLRTMVWQLSISQGFLSSAAPENAMSFKFPIEISRDLIEKLFDVACTLTDVMSCVPLEQHTFEYGPRDFLNQLMSLISTLRGGQTKYLPLLQQKVQDTLTSVPIPNQSIQTSPPGPRLGEMYEASRYHSSTTSSSGNTPLGSPSLDSSETHRFMMSELSGQPSQVAGFPPVITPSAEYRDLTVPAWEGIFPDASNPPAN